MKTLNEIQDIDKISELSHGKLQLIFKHSTVCPISRMSYEKMLAEYPLLEDQADLYYLGVIEQRPLSNYVAEVLNIRHESPQLLVVRNGECIFNESHLMIDPKILTTI
jgi:bacillithiol system protein YtxJ